jgi:chromosome segregation ATPase
MERNKALNNLVMSDEEIVQMYRGAKSKKNQIKIIAQLNDTTPEKIKRILIKRGEIKDVEKQKTKIEIPTAVFKACNERIAVLNQQISNCNEQIEKMEEEIEKIHKGIERIQSEKQEIVNYIQS